MAIDASTLTSADAPEQRTSFRLTDHAGAWVVRTGTLDVFAVRDLGGVEAGPLHPLFVLNAGQAAFGLAGLGRLGITLVARRALESEVMLLSLAAIREVETTRGGALLADWVAALSRAAATDLIPKDVVGLAPGERLATDDSATVLTSKEPLIWIRQNSGTSRFLGRPDLSIAKGTTAFPLPSAAWISVQPNSEVSAAEGLQTLSDDEVAAGLAAFHRDALTCIVRALHDADDQERDRFRARSAADAKAVQGALEDLASPLVPGRDYVPGAQPGVFDTPLMRACDIIGRQFGVLMRPHPDMIAGRPVKNPVAAIAQASGVRYRRVALKDKWLKQSSEPLLVFRNADETPLALLPRRRRGYSVYDPATGSVARLDASTAATLNPFAFMFYRPFPQRALAPWDLARFGFTGSRRELATIVAMSAAAGVLALLTPVLTGVVFDTIIPNAQRGELITVAVLLVVAALVTTLFNLARSFAVLRMQGRLSLSLQSALWDRLLSLPLPFFREYAAGDLAQRSMAFSLIRDLLTGSILNAILSGIFSIFSFALLFYYSPSLALVATVMTLIAVAVTSAIGMAQVRLQRDISTTMGRISGMVVEFISGIAKFRVAGAERRAFVLWVKEFAEQKRLSFESATINTLLAVFNAVYVSVCVGVLFFMNADLVSSGGTLSTGQFLAFMAAFGQFMASALGMGRALVGAVAVVPLYERASPILRALPEVLEAQSAPPELRGELQAHHLFFRYNANAPLVLHDVSFHVRPGEYVAFVGPSGCGKSTLFRLLLGFEKPESGSITYDHVDLAGLDAAAVRRQIGVVLQSGTLLAGSIADNISGAAVLPMEALWEAARMAGIEEDIKAMPMGMHTIVQAGGGGLSGGQRQRILIARAVVARPRLMLFDEATSALDNRTQEVVSESLKRLQATRIVIAHRLSTILNADRIIVMDRGRIVQVGNYEELMRQPGLFRELAERQLT
jgi:NHLM bacteriocin system ABC transporter ATP-binding protein